jgi:hypothetical protein
LRFAFDEYKGRYVMVGPFIDFEDYEKTENYLVAGFPPKAWDTYIP